MNAVRVLLSVKISLLPISIFSYSTVTILYPVIMEEAYGDYRESSGKRASEAIVGTGIGLVVAERTSVKDAHQSNLSASSSCQNCAHVDFA